MEKPLVHKKYLLEKFPGKGGWTYVVIPEILPDKKVPFGWVKVKGSIDDYTFKNYRLMSIGNGKLFLPIKAEIRKLTGKKEGDVVTIILYEDNDPLEIPEELLLCLKDDPLVHEIFLTYTEGEQKSFIDWIYAAKTEKTKAERIARSMDKIAKGQKFYEK